MQKPQSTVLRWLSVLFIAALLISPPLWAKAPDKDAPKDNAGADASPPDADAGDTFKQLTLYSDVLERVRTDYVDPVTDDKLIEASINGMLSSLDPHSGYLNKKEFQEMQTQTRGEFGGLGI